MARPARSRAASASDGKPPAGIAPGRLFRLLSSACPVWPLDLDLAGIPRLYARGLSSAEVEAAHDGGRPAEAIAALALCDAQGRPAFPSAGDIGKLPAPLADAIVGAAIDALSVVSPTYMRSVGRAWRDALVEGSRDPLNSAAVSLMCVAHDVIVLPGKIHYTERPDRFYGAPLNRLTDGQLMAFRAARQVLE